jgi:antitoxin component of MazEF toxin-antitoxin module
MLEQMKEKVTIKQIGNSAAIFLDKGSLKVYDLKIGSDLEIEYKYPKIILKKWEDTKDDESDDKK